MSQRYELLSFTPRMPVHCSMQEVQFIERHLHDYFEIDMILEGRCQALVGEQSFSLEPEDVLTVDGHVPHSFQSGGCMMICVQFDQALFERTLPAPHRPRFRCNSSQQGNSAAFDAIRRLIARLVKNNADRQTGYELRNWALVYDLMDILYNNFRADIGASQQAQRYADRVAQLSSIVAERYRENFTLTELAEQVHLSAPYLSKFFDRQFGMTFLSYLTQVRLGHAIEELLRTDHTIETVSANSGFPNSHAFVQAFKKAYGALPSVYRRQNRSVDIAAVSQPVLPQYDHMACLKKYLQGASIEAVEVSAVSCYIRCDAGVSSQRLRHTWRELTTIHSASALLLHDVQQMLSKLQHDIRFSYIKFNGIFSDEMRLYSTDALGNPVYSFAYVDKVFDFLREIGLRPFVHLSFMPEQLAKNPQKRLFGYLVSEPNDLNRWAGLVEALVRHLIDRYGLREVQQWRFCAWTQPDTPSSMYGFSSDQAFYDFYRCTYRTVKGCDGAIPFGMPPIFYLPDSERENWYIPFLTWCQENNCEPDFLNFHYYDTSIATEALGGRKTFGFVASMTLRDTRDGLQRFIAQVQADRTRLAPEKPIYLTEWNNTPSQQDLLNDTCFKSCYITKEILENYDALDSFGYWSLTDWMGEAPQPRELFFGGLGLFTASGIPKASYYVFLLLRRLGDTLIGQGEGWFAAKSETGYQFILYNYRHYSHLYAMGERFDMTFTDRYTPFSPEQTLDVHLSLSGLPDGLYTVRETILNRHSGSAFDQWLEMGALELETEDEVTELVARSRPQSRKYLLQTQQGTLELDAMLDMLEVRLLEITRR